MPTPNRKPSVPLQEAPIGSNEFLQLKENTFLPWRLKVRPADSYKLHMELDCRNSLGLSANACRNRPYIAKGHFVELFRTPLHGCTTAKRKCCRLPEPPEPPEHCANRATNPDTRRHHVKVQPTFWPPVDFHGLSLRVGQSSCQSHVIAHDTLFCNCKALPQS